MNEKGFHISLDIKEKIGFNEGISSLILPGYQHLYDLAQKTGLDLMKTFYNTFDATGLSIESLSFQDWDNEPGCECYMFDKECNCQNVIVKIVINIKDQYGNSKVEADWYVDLNNKMSIKFSSRELVHRDVDIPGKSPSEKMMNFIKESFLKVLNNRRNTAQELFEKLQS